MTTVQVGAFLGAEPPLKRSVPLMIAEFLYNRPCTFATHKATRRGFPAYERTNARREALVDPRTRRGA
ncbi:hypothetical protein GQ600_26836 [Phytophthora cactorum]|nr:hypothetical protein GQ600_26836 [Phytophthora cactorum]